VSSRKEKGEETVGVGGRGKCPGAPPHHLRKKEGKRKKQLADRKVPERQGVVKGEGYIKKKTTAISRLMASCTAFSLIMY
jgi:hypothetical protein